MIIRAAEKDVSFQALWASLSEIWLNDDHADSIGFLNAGLKSRAIIEERRIGGMRLLNGREFEDTRFLSLTQAV